MIVCCYSELDDGHEEILKLQLAQLPPKIRNEILNKKERQDVSQSVCGYLLLNDVLRHFDLNHRLSLDDLQYSPYSRPYLAPSFDFNISHSEKLVVCCGTLHGKIGIDLEYLDQPIETELYKDYFTGLEWKRIQNERPFGNEGSSKNNGSSKKTFFNLWTRKEAVLKAEGRGMYNQLQELEVLEDELHFKDNLYFITALELNSGYLCHLASTVKQHVKLIKTNSAA